MSTLVRTLTLALAATIVVVALPPAHGQDQPTPGQKLYRWVGPDGKVHYGDDIPVDVLNQAHSELSRNSGLTIKQVDRQLTTDERTAAEAKAAADAQAALALQKARENDQVLLSSYPTEKDLQRAYDDRISMQVENVKGIRMGLDNQQQSLSSFLHAASVNELQDKPVDAGMLAQIAKLHESILSQLQARLQAEAQIASLKQESATTMAHYRQLKSAMMSAHADGGAPMPAPPPPTPAPSPGG